LRNRGPSKKSLGWRPIGSPAIWQATFQPDPYDAFIWRDELHALRPLDLEVRDESEVPQMYPGGV
jgi:hypothetical protein